MFFDGWAVLLRTAAIGILAYFGLIVFLRVTGKRTLSKMNAFDFIVTVAIGSTLATILLSKDVTLVQGTLALALLVSLQFVITWSSVRIRWIRQLVTGEPSLLLFHGEFLHESMRRERVTEDEIRSVVRSAGMAAMADVEAVVLETNGSFSIVRRSGGFACTSLTGVRRPSHSNGPAREQG